MDFCRIDTPIGPLLLTANAAGTALARVSFGGQPAPGGAPADTPLLRRAGAQLQEYFAGTRRAFDLPLDPSGTPFQQRCWAALRAIPYGQTRTYGQVAARLGAPKACRAVGMANHRNPLPIVVPCHRVVGADGSLTGYAGGLDVKRFLLELEQRHRG